MIFVIFEVKQNDTFNLADNSFQLAYSVHIVGYTEFQNDGDKFIDELRKKNVNNTYYLKKIEEYKGLYTF